jgi:outer membrane protein assembly factor BamD (BamD/ComL family)
MDMLDAGQTPGVKHGARPSNNTNRQTIEVWDMKTQSLAIAAALLTAALVASCSSAQSDWTKAGNEDTVAAYQNFLAAHPNDQHANEAQAMIAKLQDANAWSETKHSGTTAAYQTYLQQSPQGVHAAEARDQITAMDRAAAWKSAQAAGAVASIQAFLQKYPTGPEADQAKAKLKELSGYRAHLASESSDTRAQRKLAQLKARYKDQFQDLTVTPDSSGKSFSIDSQGMTEQEANSACELLKRKHEACQIIHP